MLASLFLVIVYLLQDIFHSDPQKRYLETVVYCKLPAEPVPLVLGYTATVSGDRGVQQQGHGPISRLYFAWRE